MLEPLTLGKTITVIAIIATAIALRSLIRSFTRIVSMAKTERIIEREGLNQSYLFAGVISFNYDVKVRLWRKEDEMLFDITDDCIEDQLGKTIRNKSLIKHILNEVDRELNGKRLLPDTFRLITFTLCDAEAREFRLINITLINPR